MGNTTGRSGKPALGDDSVGCAARASNAVRCERCNEVLERLDQPLGDHARQSGPGSDIFRWWRWRWRGALKQHFFRGAARPFVVLIESVYTFFAAQGAIEGVRLDLRRGEPVTSWIHIVGFALVLLLLREERCGCPQNIPAPGGVCGVCTAT
eukprot:scaffold99515_cov31-Tisochrysis_lutea.AAC.4